MTLTITIPGEPVAQGRGRAVRRGPGIVVVDPVKSRSWKAYASGCYLQALNSAGIVAPAFGVHEAVAVELVAYFACPATHHRKRNPVPRRAKHSKPDVDNLLKSALDAGNGLLWVDDCQVYSARVIKLVAAQGEAPRVELRLLALPAAP